MLVLGRIGALLEILFCLEHHASFDLVEISQTEDVMRVEDGRLQALLHLPQRMSSNYFPPRLVDIGIRVRPACKLNLVPC